MDVVIPEAKDPLTERIETAVARRRMFKSHAAALAGITWSTWRNRTERGHWRCSEVAAIARVTGVSFEWLTGVEGR